MAMEIHLSFMTITIKLLKGELQTTSIIRIARYLLLSNNFVKGVPSGLKLPSILGGALSVWRVTCLDCGVM